MHGHASIFSNVIPLCILELCRLTRIEKAYKNEACAETNGIKICIVYMIITRVETLIVATIYLQLIQNRYMFRSFTVLHCSHQHCVQPVASDVEVVGYL